MRFAGLFLLLLPLAATAAEEEAAPAPTGVLTKAPELLEFIEAPYPEEAKADKLEGDVLLEVDLSDAGAVTGVRLVGTSGQPFFDAAALEAVKKFRFSPAQIDGKPAAVTITYRYAFVFRPPPPPPPPPPGEEKKALPQVTLRGQVVTLGTKVPIVGAAIGVDDGAFTTYSGEEGRFELADVPPGKHHVVIVVEGHDRFETDEEIEAGAITETRYYVRRRGAGFDVVVRAKKERKDVAKVTITAEEIRAVPGTNGDTIRVVQNLPGVARAPFGFGVLLVRGGAPQDTRGYIDGQWVPLVFHFGGLRSIYASELVSDVQFYAGNFGSRYGRAIGGAIEVESRDPNNERLHLVADASLIDALALAEGPITENVSVAAAVRRSYVDAILRAVLPSDLGLSFVVAPRYYDYQLKVVYKLSADEKLIASAYGSEDRLGLLVEDPQEFDPEARGSFENTTRFNRFIFAWEKKVGPSLLHRLEVGPAIDYLDVSSGEDLGFTLNSVGGSIRDDWAWSPNKHATVNAGFDFLGGRITYDTTFPQVPTQGQLYTPVAGANLITEQEQFVLLAPALWGEVILRPTEQLKIVPGLREDYDSLLNDFWTDLRLASFYAITDETTVKAAAGVYHQPPQIGQLSPKFGNPDLLPEGAYQYMVGGEQKLGEHLSVDLQLYYKDLFQLGVLSANTVERNGVQMPERFASTGVGRSYGAEILLRWAGDERFFGWIAYTLSRSERTSAFTGELATFALDQPHNLTLIASYLFASIDLQVGTRIRYATGNPYTPWAASVYDSDGDRYLPIPGDPFSKRAPDFFQVDLRVDRHFWFEQWKMSIYLDVQNVTNNGNVEALQSNYDYTRRMELSSLPIIPSLGIRAEY